MTGNTSHGKARALLEAAGLGTLVALAYFDAAFPDSPPAPVAWLPDGAWIAMLLAWYGIRSFQSWRAGRLGLLLRWHLAELALLATLAAAGAALLTAAVIAGLAGASGFEGLAILFAGVLFGVFYLPLVVLLAHLPALWLLRRRLPGRPPYAEALRLAMLGLAGLTLVLALPAQGLQWTRNAMDRHIRAGLPPPQPPRTIVHDGPAMLEWTLFTPWDVRRAVGLGEDEAALLQVTLLVCDPDTLRQGRPRCEPVSGELGAAPRGLLFRPPPAPAGMAPDGACRLYLHVHSERPGARIGLGTRETVVRDDYFPVRLFAPGPGWPRTGCDWNEGVEEHGE